MKSFTLKLSFLLVSMVSLPANGMCCTKSSIKIAAVDEIPDALDYETRLAIVIAENRRINKLQEQAILADIKYRREHAQLIKEAAQRVKEAAERDKRHQAAINEKHDLKMLAQISKAINDRHLTSFEKAIELDYFSKFMSSEELVKDIRARANQLYYPAIPHLEI